MKKSATWKFILANMQQQVPVMLLYVLESKGSSPGRQGFFMAVNTRDEMEGSIGGGIMEHKFVEMAKEKLRSPADTDKSGIKKQIHDKAAPTNQSGMICSGEQTIWLYPVEEKDISAISTLIDSLDSLRNGTLTLSPAGIGFDINTSPQEYYFQLRADNDWVYRERTGFSNRLFIIGGGHCSQALSKLMSEMDFYISVYDERNDLKTMLENEYAHEKIIVDDYSTLSKLIPGGSNHWVVIMTFGYRSDSTALSALMDKDFKYIGMLGSKTKIEKLFDDYRKNGIAEKRLQRIHAPIGLQIKSETPEEIAISIAAEIIAIKNRDPVSSYQ